MENEQHEVEATQVSIEVTEKPPVGPVIEPVVVESEAIIQSEDPSAVVIQKENEVGSSSEGEQSERPADVLDITSPEEEVLPWEPRLEEGFSTMRAQLAYYEFFEAADGVHSETGEEAERFFKALHKLNEHMNELSLFKLFSVLGVLFKVLFIFLAERSMNRLSPSLQKSRGADVIT